MTKILKKVVEKFFWEMCSDEFFLKHALPIEKEGRIIMMLSIKQWLYLSFTCDLVVVCR